MISYMSVFHEEHGAMKKEHIAGMAAIVIILVACSLFYRCSNDNTTPFPPTDYTYRIVEVFPHDSSAFTEGLTFENGILYEGTGIEGASSVRKVELETGLIVQNSVLSNRFFGEGITIWGDKIIQLTWLSQKGFVYNKSSLSLLSEFNYSGEGWGITNDGYRLIMSNGSATLQFLNPETFEILGQIEVQDEGKPVINLNELEFVNGDVYANIWQENRIAIINIQDGQVKGWIDLTGLYGSETFDQNNVLNGIAYDAREGRLFVTGKRWTKLFEITIAPIN